MGDLELNVGAATDTGRTRMRNEDSMLVRELGDALLLCVADGLGGHARGEWASARALEVFAERVAERFESDGPEEALRQAAAAANSAVNAEAMELGAPGAATTLVAALQRGSEMWWLNVGDSRLYRLTGGSLEQVSQDHSWVAERVREGSIPADAARSHWKRNVVTRTIGFEPEVEPDTGHLDLQPGDVLLLCSDGLFGPVTDDEIAAVLGQFEPGAAAPKLIELANKAGGPDNITVVVAGVPG